MLRQFVKTGAGFIHGAYVEDGAVVELTAEQAKYLAPPYGAAVRPVEPEAKAKKGKAGEGAGAG